MGFKACDRKGRKAPDGLGGDGYKAVLPPYPTEYLPGTDEKIQTMHLRLRGGYGLFRDDDATFDGSIED